MKVKLDIAGRRADSGSLEPLSAKETVASGAENAQPLMTRYIGTQASVLDHGDIWPNV